MSRIVRIAAVFVALGLLVYALGMLIVSPQPVEMAAEALQQQAAAGNEATQRVAIDRQRKRLAQAARNLRTGSVPVRRPEASEDPEQAEATWAPTYGSGTIDASTAHHGFEFTMGRVEKIAKSRRRLEQDEWQTLYREANDAFAALSIHLDVTDPSQQAQLDDAHRRLKQALHRVRVRGRKFGAY